MIRLFFSISLMVVSVATISKTLAGDVLILKDDEKKIFGVKQTKSTDEFIIFSVVNSVDPNGVWTQKTFPKSSVSQIIQTIDQSKINQLEVSKPIGFLELAEELSSMMSDESARLIAIRLTLHCIHHSLHSSDAFILRTRAAKLLISLAKTESEKMCFGQLFFQHTGAQPKRDAQARFHKLYPPPFLAAIRLARQEKYDLSAQALDQWVALESSREQLQAARRLRSIIEKGSLPIQRSDLLSLLKLESRLLTKASLNDVATTDGGSDRHRFFDQSTLTQLSQLELTELFDFDFEAIRFKNGRWVRPKPAR
ncbi:MAG: hypothetical protein AAGA30_06640 [Planctomycetota bacterium]